MATPVERTDSSSSINRMLPKYEFPSHRLRQQLSDPERQPLVLVACGSYSPITLLHLRMCVMAIDHVKTTRPEYEVIGVYLSPVSDAYEKGGLVAAEHRIRMCELASGQTSTLGSSYLMVDPWEAHSRSYVPTALVLAHFDREINDVLGGCGGKRVRVSLLSGADLLRTFLQPEIWSVSDKRRILQDFGVYVVERTGSDIDEVLEHFGDRWEDCIHVIPQTVPNEVSSSKIRMLLRRGLSIDYLTPQEVINYIDHHGLYRE